MPSSRNPVPPTPRPSTERNAAESVDPGSCSSWHCLNGGSRSTIWPSLVSKRASYWFSGALKCSSSVSRAEVLAAARFRGAELIDGPDYYAALAVTGVLALFSLIVIEASGIVANGPVKYARSLMPEGVPIFLAPVMIPIELISHLARPLSLTLRLFGNMTGGHILLAIIFFLMGLDGLIGWALSGSVGGAIVGGIGGLVMMAFTVGFLYPLKILVSFLQAFIFVMLTMLYIAGAVEGAEHDAHHGHAESQAAHH